MSLLTIKAKDIAADELRLLRELSEGSPGDPDNGASSALLQRVARELYQALEAGRDVSVLSREAVVTPAGAAELLGVSRAFVSVLLKTGRLQSVRVGTHHRIAAADVLTFRQRREALAEAQRLGHELDHPAD